MKTNINYLYLGMADMLFSCLLHLPYGYYTLVRFLSMVGFVYIGYKLLDKNNTVAITFFVLALLFQPIFKISLGRELWNIVDIVVALFLLTLWIKNQKSK